MEKLFSDSDPPFDRQVLPFTSLGWSFVSCIFTPVLYKNINTELIHCGKFNASALIIHCMYLHALCGIYNAVLSPKASLNLFVDKVRLLFLC